MKRPSVPTVARFFSRRRCFLSGMYFGTVDQPEMGTSFHFLPVSIKSADFGSLNRIPNTGHIKRPSKLRDRSYA